MKTSLFSFDLPERLIAQTPLKERGCSRLMVLERNGSARLAAHRKVRDLPVLLKPGTLVVFNDTRVRKARLFATNQTTGGKGEFLFLRRIANGDWECMADKMKRKRYGQRWLFPDGAEGRIIGFSGDNTVILTLKPPPSEDWFERFGHMPLPPYIRRADAPIDCENYQTVYAREVGSVAAPTAGLHFTPEILKALEDREIQFAWVTLKVGSGTFLPVRCESIEDHLMHRESFHVPEETAQAVETAKREGRPILAVGTTTVRTLESAWNGTHLRAGHGVTDLFIYPGYEFGLVDELFTNFHTPKSSLIMMVSAFAGHERLLEAYRLAAEEEYRFYSYGDAMLITRGAA
ncbi:MAG: tRNA preQ1(34) S-adenosylmethionine ribosyltransferase-isomerase QueA [spirochete symbiont of Stewartia floridana]|nr:MAG: tRNA preQ1(34) S-adenosylmethionine ribosyltransferase-isomerase QueA [spirochete symbiont of Stewartia floridana]